MNALDRAAVVAAGARVLGRPLHLVRELTGGQHAITLLTTDGAESFVVRAFPRESPAVAQEIDVLDRLGPFGAMAPRLVADGEESGHPVIVTTALDGDHPGPGLSPHTIAEEMAIALAAIHRLDGSGLRTEPQEPPWRPGGLSARAHEEWGRLDLSTRVLTHFDFWCGNALWKDDRLVGVVDWNGARSAPRGVDVAWCRQDLVLLGSVDAADVFRQSYEERAGQAVPDIHAWDILAAEHADPHVESWDVNYRGIGRSDITAGVLRHRLDLWIDELLR
ncbi:phosphotransferase family protein [Flexivirga alba]|uniref:Phosphotransferase family protein n=1 Tax=Flexivirga alba TaxID=702742 RepID=A0ABW2AM69_9MICO